MYSSIQLVVFISVVCTIYVVLAHVIGWIAHLDLHDVVEHLIFGFLIVDW